MKTIVPANTFEDDRFKTISDFKWCMKRGGEVQIIPINIMCMRIIVQRRSSVI